MARIGWGKPILQIAPVIDNLTGMLGAFITLPVPVQDSTQLTTEKGNKLEAPLEGGELADVRYDKNKYTCEFELYKLKNTQKPIVDDDGIVSTEFALRIIPEDPSNEGWIMKRASVSVEDTWASNIGHKWKYTFEALKPASGKALEPYVPIAITPLSLGFTSAADTTGKTVAVTADGTVTATSDQAWATATVAGKVVTVKVSANSGAARMANLDIASGGYHVLVIVTQEGA
jgi:hypothetical protein